VIAPEHTVRPIIASEYDAFHATTMRAFGSEVRPDDLELWRAAIELDRTSAVFDGDVVAGAAGIFTFEMTVPGGVRPLVAPVAGVTHVGVLPSHRRRGILGALMRDQLVGLHERTNGAGEPVAALYASEPSIYARFGYGMCGLVTSATVDTGTANFIDGAATSGLRLRICPADEARSAIEAVYDVVRRRVPGHFGRSDVFWRRRLNDAEHMRGGASGLTCVLAERADGAEGYALYRTKSRWDADGRPDGAVDVLELEATSPAVAVDLWRFVLDLDLVRSATSGLRPPSDPIFLLLRDVRAARMRVRDGMWVRVVDVDRGLAARGYATEVDVVLDVVDAVCPWNAGRWRLATGSDGATCDRTDAAADLTVDVRALGAAYLGGTSLSALAGAGLVHEQRDGALAAATAAFRGQDDPWCPEIF
jgi:predicted acetyltransferase